MRRFFALILLLSGLLSILSASLISRQHREDAPPLEFAADSPDARWLYYNQIEGMENVLYAQDLSSSAPPIRLLSNPNSLRPIFSPDGAWMLVDGWTREGSFLHRMRPDESERLLIATNHHFVEWINNTQVVITQAGVFYRLDLDGTLALLLPASIRDLRSWWVSGEWFFYQYKSDDIYYRMRLDTGESKVIALEGQVSGFLDLEPIPLQAYSQSVLWLGGIFLLVAIRLTYHSTYHQKVA